MKIAMMVLAMQDPTWNEIAETSALDGRASYIAGIQSVDGVRNSIGREMPAMLAVSCNAQGRTVAVQWPAFLGLREVRIRWRFDDGQIEERFIEPERSLIPIEGRDADRFMDSLAGAERVVVEVTGYQGQQETTFRVAGAAEKVTRVREACPRR